ncbi:tRNA N6-adenosine threonylcarbamoyltransferase [Boothiomyces sp. JEL0866]|nr:tRNA N6-adenosine threonylcarbamoyltransferase [Boothiomyces sp. JEL0866]
MGDYIDLPNYDHLEILGTNNETGISTVRGKSKAKKDVIIYAATYYQEGINQLLQAEFDKISHINLQSERKYAEKNLIPNPLAVEKMYEEGCLATVYEYFSDSTLRDYLPRDHSQEITSDEHLDLVKHKAPDVQHPLLTGEELLQIFLRVVQSLEKVHHAKYVHLNVNPDSIYITKKDDKLDVQLANFMYAQSNDDLPHYHFVNQNYAYVSPEQTGRTERVIDYRSDFYNLGITMWECFVGYKPFKFAEVSEIVYSHLAMQIPNPTDINKSIPAPISAIILKLTKKDPADRYQIGSAIKYDIQKIIELIESYKKAQGINEKLSNEKIAEALRNYDGKVGEKDYSQTIRFSSEPVGRVNEIRQLLGMFDEWQLTEFTKRKPTVVCLNSPFGGGKTAIIKKLTNYAISKGAFLSNPIANIVSAKISISDYGVPYAAFKSILEQIVGIILTESTEELRSWEDKLKNQLGDDNIRLLCRFIPSLSYITTDVQDNVECILRENLTALFQCILLFLDLFGSSDRPIIVNLGNLMAGMGSLELLKYLLNSQLRSSYFFVGITDDSQGELPEESVMDILRPFVTKLIIRDLNLEEVNEFLTGLLNPISKSTLDLAKVLHRKTLGNYNALTEIIKQCEKNQTIRFDQKNLHWTWDLETIETTAEVAQTKIDHLKKDLHNLDSKTVSLLLCGAYLGLKFDIRVVSGILNTPIVNIMNSLSIAIVKGYLNPIYAQKKVASDRTSLKSGNSHSSLVQQAGSAATLENIQGYKFCHWSVHDALLEMVDDSLKTNFAISAARYYKNLYFEEKSTTKMIDAARHYKNVSHLISDPEELLFVAEIFYKTAFNSSVYSSETALSQMEEALQITEKLEGLCSSESFSELVFQIKYALILVYMKAGDHARAESLYASINSHFTLDDNYKSKCFSLQIQSLVFQNKTEEALALMTTANCTLGKLLATFSWAPHNERDGIENLSKLLDQFSIPEILACRRSVSEEYQIASSLIYNCFQICQIKLKNTRYAHVFALIGATLAITDGVNDYSMIYFSLVLKKFVGHSFEIYDFKQAAHIHELVMEGIQFLDVEKKAMALYYLQIGSSLFSVYFDSFSKTNQIVSLALDSQNISLAFDAMILFASSNILPTGKTLSQIKEYEKHFKLHTGVYKQYKSAWELVFSEFEGIANGLVDSDSQISPIATVKALQFHVRTLSNFIYSRECRFSQLEELKSNLDYLKGTWMYVDVLLCMIIVESEKAIRTESTDERAFLLSGIDQYLEIMNMHIKAQASAEHAFKYPFALSFKEKILQNSIGVMENLEEAIEGANNANNLFFAAWINEIYANHWLSLKSKRIAKVFLLSAFSLWEQWGCEGKAIEMQLKYSETVKFPSTGRRISTHRKSRYSTKETVSDMDLFTTSEAQKTNSNSRKPMDIDINTVLKVTNSITNETDLDTLVNKILGHLMNNTGATKAMFFIAEKSTLKLRKIINSDSSETSEISPTSLLNYVYRTQEAKVYFDTPTDSNLTSDQYFELNQPKSILCCPIKHQNIVTGVVYLENRLQSGSFNNTRVNLVKSLMAPVSISIANAQLLEKNKELAQALQNSNKNSQNAPKYNVETPMQKVLDAINTVKTRFDPNDPIVNTLDAILSTLISDGLFAANLGEVNDKDGKGIDQDTKTWIESSLLMTKNLKNSDKRESATLPRKINSKTNLDLEMQQQPMILPAISQTNISEINTELEKCCSPEFDCFKLAEITDGSPLCFLTLHLLQKYGLFETFSLSTTVTQTFLERVESSYNKLPYHNSIHATDVLQTAVLLLLNTDIVTNFTPLEIFSIIIASAVHDLDHPGINNNFLVQMNHPMAVLYNDIAVLESHHVARAFELSKLAGGNIFESMSPDQFRQCRKMIISIVLATDLAQHFQFISKFKGKVTSSSLKLEDDADRHLVMEMVVKLGDLGNPVKTFERAKRWTNLVMEEFFRQGDREKAQGLPVSKFMDRKDTNISKCQIGFIDFLVTPLFDSWFLFSKTDYIKQCLTNIAENRERWQQEIDNPNVLPGVPASEFEKLDHLLDLTIYPISFGGRTDMRKATTTRRFKYTTGGTELEKIRTSDTPQVTFQSDSQSAPVTKKWKTVMLAAFSSVVMGLSMPIRNYLTAMFIEEFSKYSKGGELALVHNITNLIKICAIYGIIAWVFTIAERFLWHSLSIQLVKELKLKLFNKIIDSDLEWRDGHSNHEFNHLYREFDRLHDSVSERVSPLIKNIVSFIAGLSLAIYSSLVLAFMQRKSSIVQEKETKSFENAAAIIHEAILNILLIFESNTQLNELARYKDELINIQHLREGIAWVYGLGWGSYNMTMYFAFGISFFYGGKLVFSQHNTPSEILNTFTQIASGVTALGNLGQARSDIECGYQIFKRIDNLLLERSENNINLNEIQPQSTIKLGHGEIEFRNVYFKYPSRPDEWSIENLNLKIPLGKSIALIGSSGSGKSTILKLLTRLYEPTKGEILINGISIKNIAIEHLRKVIYFNAVNCTKQVIPINFSQTTTLYSGTIKNNVLLGNSTTPIKLQNALQIASAQDFVNELPEGVDTNIQSSQLGLSGGQIQRLSLARSVIGEPPVLLLDESTSALDPITETMVVNGILEQRKNQTNIFITHRNSHLHKMDSIFVFENGKVVESGKYDEIKTLNRINDIEDKPVQKSKIGDSLGTVKSKRTLIALFRQMMRFHHRYHMLVLGTIGSLLYGFKNPLQGLIIGNVVGGYSLPEDKMLDSNQFWCIMIVLLGIGSLLAELSVEVGFGYASSSMKTFLRASAFEGLLHKDYQFYLDPSHTPSTLELSFTNDVNLAHDATISLWHNVVRAIINISSGLFLKDREAQEEYSAFISSVFADITTISLLVKQSYFESIHQQLLDKLYTIKLIEASFAGFVDGLFEGLLIAIFSVGLYVGSYLLTSQMATNEEIMVVLLTMTFTALFTKDLFNSIMHSLGPARIATDHILDLTLKKDCSSKKLLRGPIDTIEFTNVTFSYPFTNSIVLDNIRLKITKDTRVVIVGPSGSGKSTFAHLLLQTFYPNEGQILVNNENLRVFSPESVRNCISVLPQTPQFLKRSVKDNLAYGLSDVAMLDIVLAAQRAKAFDFINQLPEKFDSIVQENANNFSGGQKQRLGLARLFLRNTPVVLLDEPTSALDKETEIQVFEYLDEFLKNKISFMITHRLEHTLKADLIVVMKNGKIDAIGSHKDCIENSSWYKNSIQ